MNVLLFTSVPLAPPWDQGDKNLAYQLTRALGQVRFNVLTTRVDHLNQQANLNPWPIFEHKLPNVLGKGLVYLRLVKWLRGLPEGERPDIVHYIYRPYPFSSSMLRLVPAVNQIPGIHTLPASNDGKPIQKQLFITRYVVSISRFGFKQLKLAGVEHASHIPPGINLQDWQVDGCQRRAAKLKLGLEGATTVLFPGHYGPGMGADTIVAALPEMTARIPNLRLIFACRIRSRADHSREQALRSKLAAQQLNDCVIHFQTVADMQTIVSASDLVLLPLENMRNKLDIPTTLVECMAAGIPLVISDLAPMNELLYAEDGSATGVGLAVKPGDPGALAMAVAQLLGDEALRLESGRRGALLAAEMFDIRNTAKKYETLYQEIR